MFIDYVDFDYCKTVKEAGLKIVQINNSVMEHQVGDSTYFNIFGFKQIIQHHSPIRKYYFFRNRVYYARKHKISFLHNPWFYFNYLRLFILLMFEDEAPKKFRMSLVGIKDGFKIPIN